MPSRTKITILGGFLGSGKTTLLNELLRVTDEPLGVIVNDFGSVNVDAKLIGGQQNVEGEVALQNGCICCTIRGDLLEALRSLLRRPSPPRHVVIETSGVSDPAAVARTFLHPRLSGLVELSTIVVCVDPTEFTQLTDSEWNLAAAQVSVADFVLLTKCDVASDAERSSTREVLQSIAADLRVVESSRDDMPTDLVLNSPRAWRRSPTPLSAHEAVHVHEVGEDHGHDHGHDHHHDGHAYETWTFRTEQPLSLYGLRRALRRLPPAVFRAKGLVYVAEDPDTRVVVQVAGRRAELSVAGAWDDDKAATELVFLGPEGALDPEQLGPLLEGCEAKGFDSTSVFMEDMLGYFNRLLSNVPQHG